MQPTVLRSPLARRPPAVRPATTATAGPRGRQQRRRQPNAWLPCSLPKDQVETESARTPAQAEAEAEFKEECPSVPVEYLASYEDFPRIAGIRKAIVSEEQLVALIGRLFEVVAVTVMTLYGVKAMMLGLFEIPQFVAATFKVRGASPEEAVVFRETFKLIREDLSNGIVLGLEFLIVADVFETVGKPLQKRRMEDLYKLALVVIIRTVIDLSLRGE